MARIVFVNRFYWPDEPATAQLLVDLAEAAATAGHDALVITSHPGRSDVPRRERRNGVTIHRVARRNGSRAGLVGKAADFATFLGAASLELLREARPGAIVVLLTDPPFIGVAGALACRWKGATLVHWVQDIYPEVAIEVSGQRWPRIFRPLRDAAWRHAAACVTLGSDMAALIRRARVPEKRIHSIPNWPPAGLVEAPLTATEDLRREWGLSGKFVIGYSGNLGRVHDLESVCELAAALADHTDVVFLVTGSGPQLATLQTEARCRRLSNLLFRPPQPRGRLAASLGVADVHLVTLRAGCESVVFPSKLYGIAAVARPVLFIGPAQSDIARIVQDNDLGMTFTRQEISSMAQHLRELSRQPEIVARHRAAARLFARAHSAETAISSWISLFASLERGVTATRDAHVSPAR